MDFDVGGGGEPGVSRSWCSFRRPRWGPRRPHHNCIFVFVVQAPRLHILLLSCRVGARNSSFLIPHSSHHSGTSAQPGKGPISNSQPVDEVSLGTTRTLVNDSSLARNSLRDISCGGGLCDIGHRPDVHGAAHITGSQSTTIRRERQSFGAIRVTKERMGFTPGQTADPNPPVLVGQGNQVGVRADCAGFVLGPVFGHDSSFAGCQVNQQGRPEPTQILKQRGDGESPIRAHGHPEDHARVQELGFAVLQIPTSNSTLAARKQAAIGEKLEVAETSNEPIPRVFSRSQSLHGPVIQVDYPNDLLVLRSTVGRSSNQGSVGVIR